MNVLQIEGVNGTLVANQYVRTNPSDTDSRLRTLISLDNGGNWELVRSPASVNCAPPQCSLHFHMSTTEYARTGVYSQVSVPLPPSLPPSLTHCVLLGFCSWSHLGSWQHWQHSKQ